MVRANAPPGVFTAVHLADGDIVIGVTAANNPRDVRVGQALIKARCVVDPAAAADPAVPLQRPYPSVAAKARNYITLPGGSGRRPSRRS